MNTCQRSRVPFRPASGTAARCAKCGAALHAGRCNTAHSLPWQSRPLLWQSPSNVARQIQCARTPACSAARDGWSGACPLSRKADRDGLRKRAHLHAPSMHNLGCGLHICICCLHFDRAHAQRHHTSAIVKAVQSRGTSNACLPARRPSVRRRPWRHRSARAWATSPSRRKCHGSAHPASVGMFQRAAARAWTAAAGAAGCVAAAAPRSLRAMHWAGLRARCVGTHAQPQASRTPGSGDVDALVADISRLHKLAGSSRMRHLLRAFEKVVRMPADAPTLRGDEIFVMDTVRCVAACAVIVS